MRPQAPTRSHDRDPDPRALPAPAPGRRGGAPSGRLPRLPRERHAASRRARTDPGRAGLGAARRRRAACLLRRLDRRGPARLDDPRAARGGDRRQRRLCQKNPRRRPPGGRLDACRSPSSVSPRAPRWPGGRPSSSGHGGAPAPKVVALAGDIPPELARHEGPFPEKVLLAHGDQDEWYTREKLQDRHSTAANKRHSPPDPDLPRRPHLDRRLPPSGRSVPPTHDRLTRHPLYQQAFPRQPAPQLYRAASAPRLPLLLPEASFLLFPDFLVTFRGGSSN